MRSEHILLRNRGDVVGFGKYVLNLGTNEPSTRIHGHDLEQFANEHEHLVAIHSVQIFIEFEEQPYPYAFKAIDDPPVLLGDLNNLQKAFKQVIAWDRNNIVTNPIPSLTTIGTIPRHVSAEIIHSIRERISRSPVKVRFSQGYSTSTNELRPAKRQKMFKSIYRSIYQKPGGSVYGDRLGELRNLQNAYELSDEDQDILEGNSEESGVIRRTSLNGSEAILPFTSRDSVNDSQPTLSKATLDDILARIKTGNFDESIDQFDEEMKAREEMKRQNLTCGPSTIRTCPSRTRAAVSRETDSSEQSLSRIAEQCRSPSERITLRLYEKERRSSASRRPQKPPEFRTGQLGSVGDDLDSCDPFVQGQSSSMNAEGIPSNAALESLDPHTTVIDSPQHGSSISGETARTGSLSRIAGSDVDPIPSNSADGSGTGLASGTPQVLTAITHTPMSFVQYGSVERGRNVQLKTRPYRFKTREKAQPRSISQRNATRLQQYQQSLIANPFLTPRPCCNSGCFYVVDPEYTVIQYRRFLKMDRKDRKRALKSMYIKNSRAFWFGGSYVCTRFLSKGLGFSNQLQSAVKCTPKARASSSIEALPRRNTQETKKNQIILYLRDLSDRIGDSLPTKPHSNLPLMTKKQVFERYMKDNTKRGDEMEPPSLSYWCDVWKQNCSDIKTHRHHGFTVCDTCERIRSGYETAENEQVERILRTEMDAHYRFVETERRAYEKRKELGRRYPEKYLSLIIDGADQKSYGLPHFVFSTKEDKGHKMKMKIVGVLEHAAEKRLSLFTLSEEFESGANHIIEALHRVLERAKTARGKLPPILLVQADNCTRENKNRYFLSYIDMLVRKGVFEEVQVCFLPIGHTHSDIDQVFSAVATRFKLERAITEEDMIELLGNCYTPRAYAQAMLKVANFSGLCEDTGCVRNVSGFSQFRFFRITRKLSVNGSENVNPEEFLTTCDVKIQVNDEWCPLDNSSERFSFLKFAPDLRKTPVTDTTPPDNVLQVNKHLRSCEHRIHSTEKMRLLEALRDRVYTRRQQSFHWNLQTCVEENGSYRKTEVDLNESRAGGSARDQTSRTSNTEELMEPVLANLNYSLNFFISVKTAEECTDPFWIARILRVEETSDQGNAKKLRVRWYQAKDASDAFQSAYVMSTYIKDGERIVFDDIVDVQSILCEFESLTRSGKLHVRTQKAIRQTLNLH